MNIEEFKEACCRGLYFLRRAEFSKALVCFEDVAGKAGNRHEIHLFLGVTLWKLNRLEESEARLLRAQEIYEHRQAENGLNTSLRNPRTSYYLALCRCGRGNFRKAWELLKELVNGVISERLLDDQEMLKELAKGLWQSERLICFGRFKEAFDILEKMVSQNLLSLRSGAVAASVP
jgi:tetratricopeptide (TPR) repeat protein